MKKLVSAFALVACVGVLGAGAYSADTASAADSIDYVKDGKVYMPNWMQDNSVIQLPM